MDCNEELDPREHELLRLLSQRRNKRTNIAPQGIAPHDVRLDALFETGRIERLANGALLILEPCPGHPVSPGDLVLRTNREYTCGAGVHELTPSPSSGESHLATAGVRFTENARIETDSPRNAKNPAVGRLIDQFADGARMHHWRAALTKVQRGELGKHFKRWLVVDGGSEEEIAWMIERFFAELDKDDFRGVNRRFVARSLGLADAYRRNAATLRLTPGTREADDYWAASREISRRQRESMDRKAAESKGSR